MQVTKLKRFRAAKAKTKVHLYKQLVLPIMTYPPVSTHALSKSRLATLKRIQNRAARQANNDTSYPSRLTTEKLTSQKATLKPINQIKPKELCLYCNEPHKTADKKIGR